MFNKNSAIVQIWIRLIESDKKTLEDVPELSNLKEVITEIIKG